jgi:hypothetical protein
MGPASFVILLHIGIDGMWRRRLPTSATSHAGLQLGNKPDQSDRERRKFGFGITICYGD